MIHAAIRYLLNYSVLVAKFFLGCGIFFSNNSFANGDANNWGKGDPSNENLYAIKFMVNMKVLDELGWPLRIPKENWSRASMIVKSDPIWIEWKKNKVAYLNYWIDNSADQVEWISGWAHDFVEKSGKTITWRLDSRPISDGDDSLKIQQAWNSIFREKNIKMIREAARMWRLSGDEKYKKWALDQINFYAENYTNWPLQNRQGESRLMPQSLDEAVVIIELADAARLLKTDVKYEQWIKWRDLLFIPVLNTIERSYLRTNILCWQLSARAIIGIVFDRPDYIYSSIHGKNGLLNFIKDMFGESNIWKEGSFLYNNYVVEAILPLIELAAMNGFSDQVTELALIVQNAAIAPSNFRFADGSLPTPSDSNGRLAEPRDIYVKILRVMPTHVGYLMAGKIIDWNNLIDYVEKKAYKSNFVHTRSQFWKDLRMAQLVENNGWHLFMHWGQGVKTHAQREALNIELAFDDTMIFVDQGTVSYGSILHKKYFTQPAAQNIPVINDTGQEGWGHGDILNFDDKMLSVVQNKYNKFGSVSRKVNFYGNNLYEEIEFLVNNDNSSIGVIYHTDCAIEFKSDYFHDDANLPDSEGYSYWKNMKGYILDDDKNVILDCAKRKFSIHAKSNNGNLMLWKGIAPNRNATYNNVLYFKFCCKLDNKKFINIKIKLL